MCGVCLELGDALMKERTEDLVLVVAVLQGWMCTTPCFCGLQKDGGIFSVFLSLFQKGFGTAPVSCWLGAQSLFMSCRYGWEPGGQWPGLCLCYSQSWKSPSRKHCGCDLVARYLPSLSLISEIRTRSHLSFPGFSYSVWRPLHKISLLLGESWY